MMTGFGQIDTAAGQQCDGAVHTRTHAHKSHETFTHRFSTFTLELGEAFAAAGKGSAVHWLNPPDGRCIGDKTLAQAAAALEGGEGGRQQQQQPWDDNAGKGASSSGSSRRGNSGRGEAGSEEEPGGLPASCLRAFAGR